MTVRTRKLSLAQAVGAIALLLCATTVRAAKEESPANRHVDVEANVGVHFGVEENTPLNDDLITGLSVAVPVAPKVDIEGGASYITGRDFDTDHARDGWIFTGGVRFYPMTNPEDRVRGFLTAGAAALLDFRPRDDVTPALSLGVGLRLRAGRHTGVTLKLPFMWMVDGDTNSLLLPTFGFFYQF